MYDASADVKGKNGVYCHTLGHGMLSLIFFVCEIGGSEYHISLTKSAFRLFYL